VHSPFLALLRHNKIADGLPLSVEERSCSPMGRLDPSHGRMGGQFCCDAQRGSPYSDVIGSEGSTCSGASSSRSSAARRRGSSRHAGSTRENVQDRLPLLWPPATVSMNEIDLWLERLFWIAMISIPFLAIWAGRIALRQVQTASQQVDAALQEAQTTKLFKILQHVEEQRVCDARDLVMTEIRR